MLQDPSVSNPSLVGVLGQPATTSLDNATTSRHPESDSHRAITLYCANCGEKRVIPLRCGRRSCPVCRKGLYFRLLREYLERARSMRDPKLLTLTTVAREELASGIVRTLRQCFQRLLHRKYFRDRIRGGLYVIELKCTGRGWNVHIHALIDALYLDQAAISTAWRKITGDSYVVDIRRASSPRGGLKYILKYLFKAPSLNGQEDTYDEVLKGARLVQAFGAFYRAKVDKPLLVCPRCRQSGWISEFEAKRLKDPRLRFRHRRGGRLRESVGFPAWDRRH